VENPLLEVMKQADLHCMEEVRVRESPHDTGHVEPHLILNEHNAMRI